jgi:hypothetical protein
LHDEVAVESVLRYAQMLQPDGILCVGDEADAAEISRWARGSADEFAGTFEAGLIATYDVLARFADIAPMHIMRSNHTSTRIGRYLSFAPALSSLGVLDYPKLMGFNGNAPALTGRAKPLDVTWHPSMWEFAPGWVLAHGDEGSMSRIPGSTALNLAKRIGSSVICGHTHRAGVQHHTLGFSGQVKSTLFGVEVGHLMDPAKVSYLRTGLGDWAQAFATLRIYKGSVYPELTYIGPKSFQAQGALWARVGK